MLKDDGLMVFSYHHSRPDGWNALAQAVLESGMSFVNCHPVKAEMSVAAPKSQAKEPIQLDVILVCRKLPTDTRCKQSLDASVERAIIHAKSKAVRLQGSGLSLSANDRRVILIGQFLVAVCPGRSAAQLCSVLCETLPELDRAALGLLDFPHNQTLTHGATQIDEQQLSLLE